MRRTMAFLVVAILAVSPDSLLACDLACVTHEAREHSGTVIAASDCHDPLTAPLQVSALVREPGVVGVDQVPHGLLAGFVPLAAGSLPVPASPGALRPTGFHGVLRI